MVIRSIPWSFLPFGLIGQRQRPATLLIFLFAEPQSLAAYVTDHDKLLGPGRILAGQVAFAAGYFPNALEEWRRWAASAFRGF